MNKFLEGIMKDGKLGKASPLAKRLMMDYYNSQKNFDASLRVADELLQDQKDTETICDVLYAKGLIYSYELNKPDEAVACFSNVINTDPNNPLVGLAENELRNLGVEVEKRKETTISNPGLEFTISNFPNPFNPVTVINYSLPVNEKVLLKVYDVLGREIATLVNEEKSAGTYSVNFDGSNLSSGIYFYTINAGKFSQTKKMLMMK